jgi:hypothetical protein
MAHRTDACDFDAELVGADSDRVVDVAQHIARDRDRGVDCALRIVGDEAIDVIDVATGEFDIAGGADGDERDVGARGGI